MIAKKIEIEIRTIDLPAIEGLDKESMRNGKASIDWESDARNWGGALNEAAWAFLENCPVKSGLLSNNLKGCLREAIFKYAARVKKDYNKELDKEREKLLQVLTDCLEHLEYSTPQGRAAYEAASRIILGAI